MQPILSIQEKDHSAIQVMLFSILFLLRMIKVMKRFRAEIDMSFPIKEKPILGFPLELSIRNHDRVTLHA